MKYDKQNLFYHLFYSHYFYKFSKWSGNVFYKHQLTNQLDKSVNVLSQHCLPKLVHPVLPACETISLSLSLLPPRARSPTHDFN